MIDKNYNQICLFLPNLHGGGTERVMLNLARGFAEQGLNVDMVLAKAKGPFISQVPSTVRIIDLGSRRLILSLPRLASYLRRNRPAAMLSTMAHANVVAILARALSGVSVRLVVLSPTTVSIWSQYSETIRGRLTPLLARLFYRFADTVVTVSHGASNDLIQSRIVTIDQVRVIYDPVITPDIFQKARESIDHSWFRQKTIPIILGVGRLTELKDYPTLIKAFARVRAKLPARLVILGEGEDRPRLESLVQNLELEKEVAMPGFVDNPFAYMARASVFVLSSLVEGLPNVLIQAMAVGTPVVSTNCPNGPREILGDGKYGILVPIGDVERLSQAIVDTLQQQYKVIPKNWMDQFEFQHSVHAYLRVLGCYPKSLDIL